MTHPTTVQYVTTSANAVVQMLFAYEQNPGSFTNQYRSDGVGANGVPDVLDEARWIDVAVENEPRSRGHVQPNSRRS